MNEFGRRTDEELAEMLYGSKKSESKLPPAGEPEPVVEEEEEAAAERDPEVGELDGDPEFEETPDGKGLKPKDGLGLVAGNDRLMTFLEDDIAAMEAEEIEEERRVEKNWNQKS